MGSGVTEPMVLETGRGGSILGKIEAVEFPRSHRARRLAFRTITVCICKLRINASIMIKKQVQM